MDAGRPGLVATAGRVGLLVVAVGTAWGAIATAGGGHGQGAVLVAAPAAAARNPHPVATSTSAPRTPTADRVSRDELRTPIRTPARPVQRTAKPSHRHLDR
jgi:hypothetical protein